MHSDLVVLGAGPGGYAAAFLAADAGLKVTLVERDRRLGGTCLLRGCIPSKALLHVARVQAEVDELARDWGIRYGQVEIDLDAVRARKEQILDKMAAGLSQLAKRRHVQLIHARGVFRDSRTLKLEGDDPSIPEDRLLSFDYLILATGSRPARPGSLAVESPRVLDSTTALELPDIPDSLLVIGGGYIGLELGTVYAHLGSRVTIVELTDGLLPGVDRDLVKPLEANLMELTDGRIHLNTRVGAVGQLADKVEVAFEGPGHFGVEQFDRALVAVGRQPSTQGLGLENTQVQIDQRGFVRCDRAGRTHDPRIWAIGDVVGEPMLAHKATHEAKVAVESVVGHPAEFAPAAIPAVVFTDPEIAWAGVTETQAKRDSRRVETAVYPWAASGRAHALGRPEGLTKWLVDPDSHRLVGCGIVGCGAGELIAEAVLAIEMGCEVRDITDSIHPHPTLSETLMNAGEVYYGTAVELYKPRR